MSINSVSFTSSRCWPLMVGDLGRYSPVPKCLGALWDTNCESGSEGILVSPRSTKFAENET